MPYSPSLGFIQRLVSCCSAILALAGCGFTNPLWAIEATGHSQPDSRPNLIFVIADDLGYGELGCYGQTLIRTPQLDRMAREGTRFTQFYAGNTVCAPSRCVLMTGMHMGRASVRGNAGGSDMDRQTLNEEDLTVAEVLKSAGYTTSLCGKWGLGEVASTGHPMNQGFNEFFGYLNQVHAHNYYPEFLWNGLEKKPLRNVVKFSEQTFGAFVGGHAIERIDYSHDLVMERTIEFVERKHDAPFFLYLALTIPHGNNEGTQMTKNGAEVPSFEEYANEEWSEPDKCHAAMISHMDRDIGRLLDTLNEQGIADNTLVVFTSDNGPHNESGHHPELFKPGGPLRGMKRALYEGGIRVPMICWWPGKVPAGMTSDHVSYAGDWMATAAELAGVQCPADTQSISFVPSMTGQSAEQSEHEYLYWEFYEQGSRQSVRFGDWKAIRQPMFTGPIELYNLATDLSEQSDLSDRHPDRVRQAAEFMDEAHVSHPNWQVPKPKNTKADK